MREPMNLCPSIPQASMTVFAHLFSVINKETKKHIDKMRRLRSRRMEVKIGLEHGRHLVVTDPAKRRTIPERQA